MLSLKFCYKNEIHKCLKVPKDYKTLIETIHKLYKNHLTSPFDLQYEDIDEDRIMLANEDDYEVMLKGHKKGRRLINIYITDKGNIQLFQLRESYDPEHEDIHNPKDNSLLHSENYQLITKNDAVSDDDENSSCKSDLSHDIILTKLEESIMDSLPVIKEIDIKEQQEQGQGQKQNHEFATIEDINSKQLDQKIQAQFTNSKDLPTIQGDITIKLNDLPYLRLSPKVFLIHKDIKCNSCGLETIIGIRYKCTICNLFNLCEACEQTSDHMHPLINIKHTDQVPTACNTEEIPNYFPSHHESNQRYPCSPIQSLSGSMKTSNVPEANNEDLNEMSSHQGVENTQPEDDIIIQKPYECEVISQASSNASDMITTKEKNISKVIKLKNTGLSAFPSGTYIRELDKKSGQKVRVPMIEINKVHELTLKIPSKKKLGKHTSQWIVGFVNKEDIEEIISKPYEFTYEVVRTLLTDIASRAKILQEIFPGKKFEKYYQFVKYSKCITMDQLIDEFMQKFP